jgi:hypothetical protein
MSENKKQNRQVSGLTNLCFRTINEKIEGKQDQWKEYFEILKSVIFQIEWLA